MECVPCSIIAIVIKLFWRNTVPAVYIVHNIRDVHFNHKRHFDINQYSTGFYVLIQVHDKFAITKFVLYQNEEFNFLSITLAIFPINVVYDNVV